MLESNQNIFEFIGIEKGLNQANRKFISVDKIDLEKKKKLVELLVSKIVECMRKESYTFDYLFDGIVGGGSAYEGLKINRPNEFDMDILLTLPKYTKPILLENNIPGYVNMKLKNFHHLQSRDSQVYQEMQIFVDEKNYLLTKQMKESFLQRIFDRTIKKYFRNNIITLDNRRFHIVRIQSMGPAFTLTIKSRGFNVSVDLVPCILLTGNQWPRGGFKPNPYRKPSDFCIVPKSPKWDLPHIQRYWRLSFQNQEREMIADRQFLKPTIRTLKMIRDNFHHKISSYAIKTIFLHKLQMQNPDFNDETDEMWLSGPYSFCVVHMLKVYLQCLRDEEISYFWNNKFNLLDDLSHNQCAQYVQDIENVIFDITENPVPKTILKYLNSNS